MIDHLLGRPSQRVKKVQVSLVGLFWLLYLLRGPRHGPNGVQRLSQKLSQKLTAWQICVLTMTGLYFVKSADKILGLESPEPLAGIYSRSFFRATWMLTAFDAGFWTAMPIRNRFLRELASVVFSLYYLAFAEQADEKVRKVRATITAEHLRLSWEKGRSPVLGLLKSFACPRIQVLKAFEIARPPYSLYAGTKTKCFLYYDGLGREYKSQTRVVLDFPGGGFVCMTPRDHDDSLCTWAKRLRVPVVSVDYGKAPENPYPYSLDQCCDVYLEIIRTRGRCIGLSGLNELDIVLIGDSAGGNFVAGTMLKLLTHATKPRLPISLILVYPALDLNFTSWMTDEQIRLLRQESQSEIHSASSGLMRRKESVYGDMSRRQIYMTSTTTSTSTDTAARNHIRKPSYSSQDGVLSTSLAMTSRVSYFGDRIITPEMLRAMIILYIGPRNSPDFATDYLLSPVNAPTELLARFPKVYMLCGEVDPLVDDTVIFAGRLRESRRIINPPHVGNMDDGVEVVLVKGCSHGLMQFAMLIPEGRAAIDRCGEWAQEAFTNYGTVDRNLQFEKLEESLEPRVDSDLNSGGRFRALLTKLGLQWIIAGWNNKDKDVEFDEFEDDFYQHVVQIQDDDEGECGSDDDCDEGLMMFHVGSSEPAAQSANARKRRRRVRVKRGLAAGVLVEERDLMDRRRNNLVRSLEGERSGGRSK
ncbi:Alpha/Beta hydrolase protein [Lipomyces oligophaga]|uniref:Alpha/Beta hydrolase protein n=1 Tax=Lipomyces oligophaga TaxID=45792 RepID=UPI0034CDA4C5